MILSALHEATLDSRVLQFLKTTQDNGGDHYGYARENALPCANREPRYQPPGKATPLDDDQSPYLTMTRVRTCNDASPFYHIERLIYPLRIYNSPPGQGYHPSQWRLRDNSSAQVLNGSPHAQNGSPHIPNESPHVPNGSAPTHLSGEPHGNDILPSSPVHAPPILNAAVYKRLVEETKSRLHAMLECQHSFGTTVGSPVAFFIAAFIYTLVNTLSGLGNETLSLSLAFGFWWMTVPQ
jgi:hypothetical protein